ncbi:MAG: PAS domain S-box protein, partial [Deltaproteobacteria bacterium]|nr:PAS domain S-box protein [Deltaproteobacteria bacterium]
MDSEDIRDRKDLRRITLSVVLAALAVILLILLLTVTVRYAREKEMVRQFGQQQAAIARGIAARLEDLILPVERSLMTLAANQARFRTEGRRLKAAYDEMEGKVSFLAVADRGGTILSKHPPFMIGRYGGFGNLFFFRQVLKTGKMALSAVRLPGDEGVDNRSVAIGVPITGPEGQIGGVVVAIMPLTAFDSGAMEHAGGDGRTWLIDAEGTILFHPHSVAIGRDAETLELAEGSKPFLLQEDILAGAEGYGEYPLAGPSGQKERYIVAYAPVRLASGDWFVATATPYLQAIDLFRKTFLNIMIGAAGLILSVIIAAAVVVYASRRGLENRTIRERLRERELWQEKMVREKKTIEGIIEGSPIPTFVLNGEHRIILWNRACMELTGFKASEMIGTENQYLPFYNEKRPVIADLILERDFEGIEKYYGTKQVRRSITVEGAYEARDFYRDLGGLNRHLYFIAAPIYDEKGQVIAAIETIQDISKEEEMANDLREYADSLQAELQENIRLRQEIESLYNHLQSIVDSLPERLFVLTSDGTIHYVSRDVKTGLGMTVPQVQGKHFLELVPPEYRDLVSARWEDAKRGVFTPYEMEVKARDGSPRMLLITVAPIRGTDRYVIVQRDITEFKRLEAQVYESQKMAAVGQLSAGIAHEVRNPLSSIKMSLRILEKRMHPTGNDLKRFRIAEREVEHLEDLVRDVLIYARPAQPKKETADIRKVVEQALDLAEKALSEKGIDVRIQFAADVPVCSVDPSMLEQAFLNLLLNAVDALEPGGILTLSVRKASPPEGAWIEVEIEDNGCGIDEGDMPHLFNPFFTRKKDGTGLGLTQVKKIVEMHGGSVEVFSRKGEGTRVRVRFPILSNGSAPPGQGAA